MCVFLCQQFPTFPVAENPIGHFMRWQRYAGALTLSHVVDNRRVATDVPPNGRYVTLVGGQSGARVTEQARYYRGFTLARPGGFSYRLRKESGREFG
jgi:hypothetical protein